MPRVINFVRERRRRNEQQVIADQRSFVIGAIVCAVGIGLTLISSGVKFWIDSRVAHFKATQQALRDEIRISQDAEESLTIFAHKLTALTQLDKGRKNKSRIIEDVNASLSQLALIEQITLNTRDGVLVFALRSSDLSTFSQVVRLVNSAEFRARYKSVSLSTLSKDKNGGYSISLTVPL